MCDADELMVWNRQTRGKVEGGCRSPVLHLRVGELHAHGGPNTLQGGAQLPGAVLVARREHNGPALHTDWHVEAQRCNTTQRSLATTQCVPKVIDLSLHHSSFFYF